MKKISSLLLFFLSIVAYAQTPCNTPLNLDPTNITENSVQINWSPNGGVNPANGFDIYINTNNATPTPATIPTITGAAGPSRTVNSLSPATTYYAWVRSHCSSEASNWSISKTFTTLCSQTLPYVQDFESTSLISIPVCTTQQYITSPWSVSTIAAGLGFSQGKVLRYNFNNASSVNGWWFTYKFNLQAGVTYIIKFKKGNEDVRDAATHRLRVAYGTAANAASMTNIKDFTTNQTVNAKTEIIYFTPPADGEYYFGFNVYTPTGITGKGAFFLDDLSISASNNCLIPNDISAGAITQNSATISWTAPSNVPSEGYDVYYSESDAEPTAATIPNYQGISGLSQSLSSLVAGKKYYVWLRSRCSSSEFSNWSGIGFYAGCPAGFSVPFTENFEESTAGDLPNCSLSTGNNWTVYNNYTYSYTGNNSINWPTKALHFNFVTDVSDWFFTSGINLEAGKEYKITYQYGKGTPFAYDNLRVAYGTTQNPSSMINTLGTYVPVLVGKFSALHTFTVPVNGIYYFGFNSYVTAAAGFSRGLAIDNIKIEESGNVLAVENTNVDSDVALFPNPFKDILNISDVKNLSSVTVNDLSGRQVKTFNPQKELDLSDLNAGIYMVSLKYKNGSVKVIKAVKK